MSKHWEQRVCDYFVKNNIIPEKDRELYEYGLTQGVVIIINILVTLLLGFLFNSVWQSIFFTLVYVPLRTYMGGYHAKTQTGCYIISICLIITVLSSIKLITLSWLSLIIFICISMFLVLKTAPIDNENKPLEQDEKVKYKRYSIIIYCIEIGVLLASFYFEFYILASNIFCSLAAVMIMGVIEVLRQYIGNK